MRKSTFWISVLFVTVSFIVPSVAIGVTLSIYPAEQVVSEVGEVIIIDVKVSEVTNLFGFQFDLTFEPTALQATAVEEENFLKSDGEDTFWNEPVIDNDAGTITSAICTRLKVGGIDGDGVLATITFKALEVKESKIELQNVTLSDFDVKPIEADVVSPGKIVVGEVTTFNIDLAVGINSISVPLKPKEEWQLSDLADFIGKESVTLIIWYDKSSENFFSYMPTFPEDSPTNTSIKRGEGYIVLMKAEKSVTFKGTPWKGDVSLQSGINAISVPLDSGDVWRLSDLADFIGRESVKLIIWYDKSSGKFVSYMPTFPETSPTNAVVKGGEGYIVVMKGDKNVTFAGKAWSADVM